MLPPSPRQVLPPPRPAATAKCPRATADAAAFFPASRPQLSARRAGFPPNPLLHSGIFWGYATFGSGGVALFHISVQAGRFDPATANRRDRKSTRLNSSH